MTAPRLRTAHDRKVLILLSAIVHAVVNVPTKRADDKYAMRLLMGGFSVLIVAAVLRGRDVFLEAGHWKLGIVLGALAVISYNAALLAFRIGATAELAALRETSVLFGTVLAVLLLGEKMNTRRWTAVGIVVIGAILSQSD